jgi:hypothetical protein
VTASIYDKNTSPQVASSFAYNKEFNEVSFPTHKKP